MKIFLLITCQIIFLSAFAQNTGRELPELKWRMIGPHRGGRTVGAVGVPDAPNVFYIGVNNGGIWKTTDYGRTWQPIFDEQSTGSIGDIAVAPSNTQVIYAGSGEGLQRPDLSVGNGMYRSSNGGKTWEHTGLDHVQQIGGIAVDPRNENRVFVAALGHPYGPNPERGVYRTTDGGKNWERVLYKDENTGAVQVQIDPENPQIVYADLWAGRQGPWENGAWNGPESGLFKSTDGGNTWVKLTKGLPTTAEGLGRIGFTIAPSNTNRIYATVDAGEKSGVYRSDNAGESFYKIQTDERLFGRGSDFAEIKADPKNADIVYTANVVTWKSVDGGKTWKDFRGAPGGDDYHRIWINPTDPSILLIASDQGAIVTVNGGKTFSSWYNQPTAQFYHVSTDNSFPYNVYGGQQESGSVGIASRGNDGQITFREWHPVGAEEYGYVAADPLNPDIIYGGKLTRYNKKTGQSQNVSPVVLRSGLHRFLRTAPVLFSPLNPHLLFYAGNVLFKTYDGGNNWQEISPDLSRETWDIPASVGIYNNQEVQQMKRRGVIYTIAPSPLDSNIIWAGTDDGYIHVTGNGGKKWVNVTPASITSWNKISLLEAGHFDKATAYAAVNKIRLDDLHPYIFRTHDGGKTWKTITNGLPDDPVNAIREDRQQKGLLFAATEKAVYVSFDDGDHWQSLKLNMPPTSVRDIVIHENDLVAGTHGRSFWILDDIAPLRSIAHHEKFNDPFLFPPSAAVRVRWNMNTDTPLPQEEPAGQNPPDGAIIDYYLPEGNNGTVHLEIRDDKNNLVAGFSSTDTTYALPPVNIPLYWIRPQQVLSAAGGFHRFIWDLHYTALNLPPAYPIAAIFGNTAPEATSPWVLPGKFHVSLTVNGKKLLEPIMVVEDPRVDLKQTNLKLQHDLSLAIYQARKNLLRINANAREKLSKTSNKELADRLQLSLAGDKSLPGFLTLVQLMGNVFNNLQESDMAPTSQSIEAAHQLLQQYSEVLKRWNAIPAM